MCRDTKNRPTDRPTRYRASRQAGSNEEGSADQQTNKLSSWQKRLSALHYTLVFFPLSFPVETDLSLAVIEHETQKHIQPSELHKKTTTTKID